MSGHRAYLGLGGNIGKPEEAMGRALRLIDADAETRVVRASSLYRTPPWGKTDQPDFLNAVAEVATGRPARRLLDLCLDIEQGLKRVRGERWGPRSIDIDILWYDGRAIEEEGLHIPHPRMLERAFVLLPLAEVAPALMLHGKTAVARAAEIGQAGIAVSRAGGEWWKGRRTPRGL